MHKATDKMIHFIEVFHNNKEKENTFKQTGVNLTWGNKVNVNDKMIVKGQLNITNAYHFQSAFIQRVNPNFSIVFSEKINLGQYYTGVTATSDKASNKSYDTYSYGIALKWNLWRADF